MNIEQNPVIALVVDRLTGRVVDSERYTYGPYLTEMVQRHDLLHYDIILRAAVVTDLVAPEEEIVESESSSVEHEPLAEPSAVGDDPF